MTLIADQFASYSRVTSVSLCCPPTRIQASEDFLKRIILSIGSQPMS
jgi:hypothetical protein